MNRSVVAAKVCPDSAEAVTIGGDHQGSFSNGSMRSVCRACSSVSLSSGTKNPFARDASGAQRSLYASAGISVVPGSVIRNSIIRGVRPAIPDALVLRGLVEVAAHRQHLRIVELLHVQQHQITSASRDPSVWMKLRNTLSRTQRWGFLSELLSSPI